MQWAALWQMALALLPLPAAAWAQQAQDADERERQRALMLASLREYARVAAQAAVRVAQLLAGVAVLFVAATILYSVLYYLVIPSRLHEQQIFFDYGTHAALSTRPNSDLPLTLPTARLNLLDADHQWTASPLVALPATPPSVLVPGVRYDVIVELTMPESRVNTEIGMFMVETTLASQHGGVLASSARAAIVKDAHALVQWTRALAWLVPYALRLAEPAQTLVVPVVNGFQESKTHPLTNVDLRLNHPALQIYDAKLTIIAQLSGVRYLMYHWSVPTALLVILNFVFVEALALLVLYALYQLPPATAGDDAPRGGDADDESSATGGKTLDQGELFERHRSGGIPPVHVERAVKQEPSFADGEYVVGGAAVASSSLMKDEVEWNLRYGDGDRDGSDAAFGDSFETTKEVGFGE